MISCCCQVRAQMGDYNAGEDAEDERRGWRCTKCHKACEVRLEDFDVGPDPVTALAAVREAAVRITRVCSPDYHLGGEQDD